MNHQLILDALKQPLEAYKAGTGPKPDETVLRAYQEVYKQVVRNQASQMATAKRLKQPDPVLPDLKPHMDLLDEVVDKITNQAKEPVVVEALK